MNRNPSPETRFKSGNPGRLRKPPESIGITPMAALSPDPVPEVVHDQVADPRSVAERLAAKLMNLVDTGSDAGEIIRAARLLASKEMAPGVKELAERAKREAHERRMIPHIAMARETIAYEFSGVENDEAEEFLVTFAEWMVDEDEKRAGEIFFDLAVEYGWLTKEKLLADRAAFQAERLARIEAGKTTSPASPRSSPLIPIGNVLPDDLDQVLPELHRQVIPDLENQV